MENVGPEALKKIFLKYATSEKNGEKVISNEDFVTKFLDLLPPSHYNPEEAQLIASIVDKNRDGFISFSEFQEYESLLRERSNAFFETLCLLFDTNRSGVISYDNFSSVISKTSTHRKVPTLLESPIVSLYFGQDKSRQLPYTEFSQFIHDLHDAYALEGYKAFDQGGKGSISREEFKKLLFSVRYHMLTQHMKDILNTGFPPGRNEVSFAYFSAFTSLLNNMALMKRIYLKITVDGRSTQVSKEKFLHSAQMMSQITPMEVDILFEICGMLQKSSGAKITYTDLVLMTPEQFYKTANKRKKQGFVMEVMENIYRFLLGVIAGACGAAAIYPMDMVKTRMQNQRFGKDGKRMYNHSLDCFVKIIRNEGPLGLYRGLPVQIMGVSPEQALKLAVNDFVRGKMKDDKGNIKFFPGELLAGCCAGFSQTILTNPLETIKVRLQTAGETGSKVTAMQVIRELGLRGLYRGVRACWMRDIGFSGIYFPTYAHAKLNFADASGYNHPLSLMAAGFIGGVPAAALVTPFDVIKTRLQVIPRPGQTTYNGVIDAMKKIYKEEGITAFYKGALPRVCRSSPQFAVTLLVYEVIQKVLHVDFGGASNLPGGGGELEPTMIDQRQTRPDHVGGYLIMRQMIIRLGHKFGIKFEGPPPPPPLPPAPPPTK